MAKVHYVRKARRARRKHGIRKGHPYFWWKHARCEKQFSLLHPRPSQTARSDYLRSLYQIQETYDDIDPGSNPDEIASALEELESQLKELRDNCQEKHDNISDKFPNGCPSMEQLQQRIDDCEGMVDSMERIRNEIECLPDECDCCDLPSMNWEIN